MKRKRFYWLVHQSVVNNYCGLCTVKANKESKNIQKEKDLQNLKTVVAMMKTSSIDVFDCIAMKKPSTILDNHMIREARWPHG